MLFVVLLAQLLLTACEARGADKKCEGRGYCAQWLNLSSNPYATYSDETGEWSCTYGQTAVGEIDCTDQTWHESCGRVYVSPVTLDRTDSCEAHPDDCNRDKPWKCDCVSEAEAEEGMSLAWMWHFVILPSMVLGTCCFCVAAQQHKPAPASTIVVVGAASSPTANSTGTTAHPPNLAATVPSVTAPAPQMDLAQRTPGGTDTASTTAPMAQEIQPLQPMEPTLTVVAVATPNGAPTPALMDLQQITPINLALSKRDKITQARVAAPTALAARGLQLDQWTQVCDEFDKLLDSNFFVNCPTMEAVYWCCPLGPVQCLLCMLNPISWIVCIQPQESAKKECVAACNRVLEPFGAAIEITESMSGESSVHWVPLQSSIPVAPTVSTAPTAESRSSPLDPGYTAQDPGSSSNESRLTSHRLKRQQELFFL